MTSEYVHGYEPRENRRLQDQASALVELLHSDTTYPEGSCVLEAGCGVGAQTVTLATGSPKALITSIDLSEASVAEARKAVRAAAIDNVTLGRADTPCLRKPDSAKSGSRRGWSMSTPASRNWSRDSQRTHLPQ